MSEVWTHKQYQSYLTDTDEHALQSALIAWAHSHKCNALHLLYANVNGQYRRGQRPEAGLVAGVPDLTLPIPRDPWHGLYMELKVEENDLTPAQFDWLIRLDSWGYAVTTCWTLETAKASLLEYLHDPGAFVSGP